MQNLRHLFTALAKRASRASGQPLTFALAVAVVVVWAATGPLFGFSDTWQLVINTSTTIVTFLMVFLIQNTQNRDSAAVQIKLDELIRTVEGANNAVFRSRGTRRSGHRPVAERLRAFGRGRAAGITARDNGYWRVRSRVPVVEPDRAESKQDNVKPE